MELQTEKQTRSVTTLGDIRIDKLATSLYNAERVYHRFWRKHPVVVESIYNYDPVQTSGAVNPVY
jgi:hypothetical protein